MRISVVVAWFDMWIGVFVDRRKNCVYVFPMPCVGLKLEFSRRPTPQ